MDTCIGRYMHRYTHRYMHMWISKIEQYQT